MMMRQSSITQSPKINSFSATIRSTPLLSISNNSHNHNIAASSRSRALVLTTLNEDTTERFRLHNLSPQEGSKKKKKRKGRGHSAGQGGSCGYGMRGQKSRSGPKVRPGFEGGQTPLYRRIPKLKGVAGGMPAGTKKFVTVNVKDLNQKFREGETVSLEELKERRILHISGKEKKLPLKILGDGKLEKPLVIQAAQFSKGAKEKIEEIGGTMEVIALKPKWTRQLHDERIREGKIKEVSKKTRLRLERERLKAEKLAAASTTTT